MLVYDNGIESRPLEPPSMIRSVWVQVILGLACGEGRPCGPLRERERERHVASECHLKL